MRTLVLLSGGIDSATVLAMRLAAGDECAAVGFDYGQPHKIELERARAIATLYRVSFEVVPLPVMPKVNDVVFAGRNLVFAGIAIATAQARGFDAIAVGCNATDWPRFPDCRPEFWDALATAAKAYDVKVEAPILHLSKREVVETAARLGVPIDLTWSCYAPRDGKPCGECLACQVRREAGAESTRPA